LKLTSLKVKLLNLIPGRNEENLKKAAGKCKGKSLIIVADVCNAEDRVRIIEKTISEFGKLDVLVNSAGVLQTGSIEQTCLEQYDFLMVLLILKLKK
jgi:NADP-dependent 3-hydroxy acid dehydrogenase YdfG